MGPKLGDLFHSLTVPSYYWTHYGIKTNFLPAVIIKGLRKNLNIKYIS
mgnify:CR=1 FL=1